MTGRHAALVVFALALARPADAECIAPDQSGTPFLVWPADGDTDVPINAPVVLHWPDPPSICNNNNGCFPGSDRLILRTGDVPVAIWVSEGFAGPGPRMTHPVTMAPMEPLAPQTPYQVVRARPDGSESVVGGFTTGSATDDLPPAGPAVARIEIGPLHDCGPDDHGCCVPTRLRRITIVPVPAAEPVVYAVTYPGGAGTTDQRPPIVGYFYCDGAPGFDRLPTTADGPLPFAIPGGAHELELVATDRAGHRSSPTVVTVVSSCDPASPDGGAVILPPDGGSGGAADASAADGGGGCAVGGRGRPGTAALLALAAIAGLARRRRRALVTLCAAGCAGPAAAPLTRAPACEVPAVTYRLATVSSCPGALALTDNQVFWVNGARGLMSLPKCGSVAPPVERASGVGDRELAADATHVYFISGERVMRLADDGDAPEVVVEDLRSPQQLHVDEQDLFVSGEAICIVGEPCSDAQGLLWRAPKIGGGTPVALYRTGGGQLFDLVGDDEHVYFTGSLQNLPQGVDRIDKRGGPLERLDVGTATSSPYRLAIDAADVYVTTGGEIRRLSTGGGAAEIVVSDELLWDFELGVDDRYVYWVSGPYGAPRAIQRWPKGGGAPAEIVNGFAAERLAIDRGALYFSTCEPTGDGAIYIVATGAGGS